MYPRLGPEDRGSLGMSRKQQWNNPKKPALCSQRTRKGAALQDRTFLDSNRPAPGNIRTICAHPTHISKDHSLPSGRRCPTTPDPVEREDAQPHAAETMWERGPPSPAAVTKSPPHIGSRGRWSGEPGRLCLSPLDCNERKGSTVTSPIPPRAT